MLFSASRGFWLVNSVNFGDGIAYFGFLALMTLFMEKNVGLSTSGATLSISVFSALVTGTMVLGGGWVSDKLGVRKALSLSMGIILVGRVLLVSSPMGTAEALVHVAAWSSLIIMAIGEGILQPALYAGVKEYTTARTATMGYALLYSIMNLGIVAGELLSPMIRGYWAKNVEGKDVSVEPTAGIAGSFWFFIGITALVLAINMIFFTRRVEQEDRLLPEPDEVPDELLTWREKLASLPILDRRFLFFLFILLPVRTLFAHQFLTMPHYVTRAFPPEVGSRWEWINGLNPFVIVVFVPLIAALTYRVRVVDMMIVGTFVSATATFFLVPGPALSLLLTYMVIWSLGEAMWSSRFLEYVADIAPLKRVGLYMGIAGVPWFLAKSVTGTYAGTVLDRFVPEVGTQDPGTMWLIYGLIAMISPIGLLVARGWLLGGVHGRVGKQVR